MSYFHVKAEKIEVLSENLKGWAQNVLHRAQFNELSVHDALCELQEQELVRLSNNDCEKLMIAMDSYWEY
jgi:hypothetical protein